MDEGSAFGFTQPRRARCRGRFRDPGRLPPGHDAADGHRIAMVIVRGRCLVVRGGGRVGVRVRHCGVNVRGRVQVIHRAKTRRHQRARQRHDGRAPQESHAVMVSRIADRLSRRAGLHSRWTPATPGGWLGATCDRISRHARTCDDCWNCPGLARDQCSHGPGPECRPADGASRASHSATRHRRGRHRRRVGGRACRGLFRAVRTEARGAGVDQDRSPRAR